MEFYRQYDAEIGKSGTYVCVGQCALWRAGLTTAIIDSLQVGTLFPEINGTGMWKCRYYLSPWAHMHFATRPSKACDSILEPTQERALIETMYLHENFDEGVLIESCKDYLYHHDDLSALYDLAAEHFPSNHREILDYWLNEARNDYDD